MTVEEFAVFLIDKKEHYDLSDEFMKDYQQKRGGYIDFARAVGHPVDPKKGEPNQKWHFFESYLIRSFMDGTICWKENPKKPQKTKQLYWNENASAIYSRLHCPELLLWIMEAAGVDRAKVKEAKEKAEEGKENKKAPPTIGKEIRQTVPWETVEKAVEEAINRSKKKSGK